MSEDDESVAGALLAELEAGGEFVDAGGFSIDAVQARTKLRDFQLADPHEYALLLIEAAVLAGAKPVRVLTGAGELSILLGPLRIERDELDQLFAAAFVDLAGAEAAERDRRRALQKLAFACNAALRLDPNSIEIAVVGGESALNLRLTPDKERGELEVVAAASEQSPEVLVRMRHKSVNQQLREPELIRERCRFSEHEIELDGQRVSIGHRFAMHVELDPERPALSSNARRVRPIELDGRQIGRAGFRYANQAPAEVRILTNGVLAERFELGDEQRPAANNFGAIVELDLPKDLGQTKLLRGPEYQRVIEAIWAVHDQLEARKPSRRGSASPEQAQAGARPFSLAGLAIGGMVTGFVMVLGGFAPLVGGLLIVGCLIVVLVESSSAEKPSND